MIILLTTVFSAIGQELQKPPEGKCLVYFFRSGGSTAMIDFKYFDGEEYLGRAGGNNYYIYECDPGEHVFWVSAENREFIAGELKPNSTYVIEVKSFYRAVRSGVELAQVSPEDQKSLKSLYKLIKSSDPVKMRGTEDDMSQLADKAMKAYEARKESVQKINPDWTF